MRRPWATGGGTDAAELIGAVLAALAVVGVALGDVVVVLVCALLALSVTTLVRSTTGGVTIALAVPLVLPVAVPSLHAVLGVDLVPLLLTYAAPMAAALHDPAGTGALVRDVAVTAAWTVVPAATVAFALVRRDAGAQWPR